MSKSRRRKQRALHYQFEATSIPFGLILGGLITILLAFKPVEFERHEGIIKKIWDSDKIAIELKNDYQLYSITKNEHVEEARIYLDTGQYVVFFTRYDSNRILQIQADDSLVFEIGKSNFSFYMVTFGVIMIIGGIYLIPQGRRESKRISEELNDLYLLDEIEADTYPEECKPELSRIKEEYRLKQKQLYRDFHIKRFGVKRLKERKAQLLEDYNQKVINCVKEAIDLNEIRVTKLIKDRQQINGIDVIKVENETDNNYQCPYCLTDIEWNIDKCPNCNKKLDF